MNGPLGSASPGGQYRLHERAFDVHQPPDGSGGSKTDAGISVPRNRRRNWSNRRGKAAGLFKFFQCMRMGLRCGGPVLIVLHRHHLPDSVVFELVTRAEGHEGTEQFHLGVTREADG